MKIHIFLCFLLAFLPEVQPKKITHINAVVNKPVTVPCDIECPGKAKWTIFIPIQADVALCDDVTCKFMDPFQESFTVSGDRARGNISLLIKSVTPNDWGSYKCSCDDKTAEVKLKVFVPFVVKAYEQESVWLPCYGDTRKDAKNLQWKKDDRTVLEFFAKSGKVTSGQGFDDRFEVAPEAFQKGDLSLHIASVRQSDAGLYLCSIHDESRDGEPRAVLLEVEGSRPPEGSGLVTVLLVLLILCVLIIVALVAILVLLFLKKKISWQDLILDLLGGGAHLYLSTLSPVQEEIPFSTMAKSSTTPYHDS